MRIEWMFLLVACSGWAQGWQNTEISFLGGGLTSSSSAVLGTDYTISGSAGFAYQIGFAYQVGSTRAGNFWLEVPSTMTWLGSGTLGGSTVASVDKNTWYMTPGLRLKTPTYGRVSFYGAAGFGYGSLNKVESVASGANGTVLATASGSLHPAGDFGGGIDLRLSRRLSVRAEGRDFVTGANLGGVSGHNHPVFLVGFAFHF